MTRRAVTIATLAALAGGAAAADRAAERVVTGDGVIASTVAGVPARLRVDPGATAMPVLHPALAARAGLKAGPFVVAYAIGPVRVTGGTAVTRIDLGAGPVKRRVGWTERPYAPGVDGVVGPGGVDDPVVRFDLRAVRPGERTIALPLAPGGGLFGDYGGAFALVPVAGAPTRVRFDIRRAETVATAGLAASLAAAQNGRLEGATTTAAIAFGVERPVRRMRLARPFGLGPLAIDTLLVRVADAGDASGIAEATAGMSEPDPDEVVVTARGKRDRRRDLLTLGRDVLDRCSSLVFDKPGREVRLRCA